jgi:hypothetical protein
MLEDLLVLPYIRVRRLSFASVVHSMTKIFLHFKGYLYLLQDGWAVFTPFLLYFLQYRLEPYIPVFLAVTS